MKTKNEVTLAFEMLAGEIQKVSDQMGQEGSKAMLSSKLETAESLIQFSKKVKAFSEKVGSLETEWKILQDELEAFNLDKPCLISPKPSKNPNGLLSVKFPNGDAICERKAVDTLIKCVEIIGPRKVASVGILISGEPFVTRQKECLKKYSREVRDLSNGWYVNLHCNTEGKKHFLEQISKALGLRLKIRINRKYIKTSVQKLKKRNLTSPRNFHRKFKISRVVREFIPELFEKGKVTDEEVKFFLSLESKRRFHTFPVSVLMKWDGKPHPRYYKDIILRHKGEEYLLTSQFFSGDCEAIKEWLEEKGYTRGEIRRVGETDSKSASNQLELFS